MKSLLVILCICASIAFAQFTYTDQSAWTAMGQCGGSAQSPINIPCAQTIIKCPSQKSYSIFWQQPSVTLETSSETNIKRILNSHNIWLRFSNQTNDYLYNSIQFQFHAPSQHAINGKSYDMQLHIVHKFNNPQLEQYAIVALFFELDETLQNDVFDNYDLHSGAVNQTIVFPIPFSNKPTYYYKGSLTAPPCTQTVNFFVQAQPYKITKKSLDKFKVRINSGLANNRLHQNLQNRKVYYIGDQCSAGASTTNHM